MSQSPHSTALPVPARRRWRTRLLLAPLIVLGAAALASCSTLDVDPASDAEIRQALQDDQKLLETMVPPPVDGSLTLGQAMARALALNMDIRLAEQDSAISRLQNDLSRDVMLPSVTGVFDDTRRNNDPNEITDPNGATRTKTGSITASWNLLELGVGYLQARQAGNNELASQERQRRTANMILAQTLQAYWRAADASDRLVEVRAMAAEISTALEKAQSLSDSLLTDPAVTLSYTEALLELQRQLSVYENEITTARIQLTTLARLPNGGDVPLKPAGLEPSLGRFDFSQQDKLERTALYARRELREIGYLERNARLGWYTTFSTLLPALTFSVSRNYDYSGSLINNWWTNKTVGLSYDFLSLYKVPHRLELAEAAIGTVKLRRVATSVSIIEQVRLSLQQVRQAQREYALAQEISATRRKIFEIRSMRQPLNSTDDLETIRAGISALTGALQEDRARATLRGAYGQALFSLGVDFIPEGSTLHDAVANYALFDKHIDDLPAQLQRLLDDVGAQPVAETAGASETAGTPEQAAQPAAAPAEATPAEATPAAAAPDATSAAPAETAPAVMPETTQAAVQPEAPAENQPVISPPQQVAVAEVTSSDTAVTPATVTAPAEGH